MLVIPSAYQFTPKDLTGVSLVWQRSFVQLTGAQVAFSALTQFPTIDPDKLWLIQHIDVNATPGATATLENAYITENDLNAGGQNVGSIWTFGMNTAGLVHGAAYAPLIYYIVRGGHTVRAFATFSSNVNPNTIQWCISGWIIPRGNIQFAA